VDLDNEYRAKADECERMASKVVSSHDKARWLQIASGWLALIRQPQPSDSIRFDAIEKQRGTGQEKSDSEH
jgi:hypothetical protein